MLGDVNKLFVFKQGFPPIVWIFIEGDGIKSRLPFKIFSTVTMSKLMASTIETDEISYERFPFLNNSTPCTNCTTNIHYMVTFLIQVLNDIRNIHTHTCVLCMKFILWTSKLLLIMCVGKLFTIFALLCSSNFVCCKHYYIFFVLLV